MRVGVDEAGKGPVLGPMVATAVGVPEPAALPDGVADSKRLAPERRETLAERLRADGTVRIGVASVSVERIDDPATDVNSLTVAAQAEAIDAVLDGDGADCTVLADACDTSEERFARRLRSTCADEPELTARHGADDDDPVVAAASVVAKVERDARVRALAEEYGDVGSGYPSDPTTRRFLAEYVAEHDALPDCARSSWQTCTDVLEAAAQSTLAEF